MKKETKKFLKSIIWVRLLNSKASTQEKFVGENPFNQVYFF